MLKGGAYSTPMHVADDIENIFPHTKRNVRSKFSPGRIDVDDISPCSGV
jgi:hypothetical protein